MPEDIDKMVDEFLEECPTDEWTQPVEVWTVLGADAEDGDPGELEAVLEALETAAPTPWYERLSRELGE